MKQLRLVIALLSMAGCTAEVIDDEGFDESSEYSDEKVELAGTSQAISIGGGFGGGGLGNQRTCPVGNCYNECDTKYAIECPAENSESTCERRWNNCVGVCDRMKACKIIDL